MKTGYILPLGLLALAMTACSPAPQPAQDADAPAATADVARAPLAGIEIDAPWIRQPPPSAPVAGGYLRIGNHDAEPDRLLAVETDAVERVEIHEMREVDGVMRMRQLEGGLEVPASGHVALEPGGYHLMLVGLRGDLAAGERVDAVLVFERAGPVEIAFEVRTPGGESVGGQVPHADHHGAHAEEHDR